MTLTISVVVVSYNSEQFLPACLDSMIKQSTPFKEIFVVDNLSTDHSVNVIETYTTARDTVRCLALPLNSGYAAAANRGINESDSDLVLVANADIILESDFNARVMEKFQTDNRLALLSPLILRFDGKTVDSAGQEQSRALYPCETGFNRPLSEVNPKEGPVFSVCGAATVFKRHALDQLKIRDQCYDEDFFIFWEDFDIGWRARLMGLKTMFFPDVRVYHFRSATLERNFFARFSLALARPAFIKYHLVKNRYLTLIKNFRFHSDKGAIPFILFKDIIWVFLLTFSAPKIIIPLMKSWKYFKNARQKRAEIKRKEIK